MGDGRWYENVVWALTRAMEDNPQATVVLIAIGFMALLAAVFGGC